MKVLLIGIGSMGLNHFRVMQMILPKKNILVFDKNKKLKNKFIKDNGLKQPKTLNELFKISHKVIIATPTNTHYKLIKDSINNSIKNIFVEKPLIKDLKESKKIIHLAKKNKVNIFVGLIERYNSVIG
jgi:predicted dehydrogenase